MMRNSPRTAMTPRRARTLSEAHLLVWSLLAGSIIALMSSSGGPGSLGGVVFLALLFALLGGTGIAGALVGRQRAQRAYEALSQGDSERVTHHVRASVRANVIAGVAQIFLFAVGLLALSKLHH